MMTMFFGIEFSQNKYTLLHFNKIKIDRLQHNYR